MSPPKQNERYAAFVVELLQLKSSVPSFNIRRFAPFESDISINLGVALRTGIIGAALTTGISLVLLLIGLSKRIWIHWMWNVLLQAFLFIYWLIAAVWLQVTFAKLSNRDCLEVYGDYVCAQVSSHTRAFLAQ